MTSETAIVSSIIPLSRLRELLLAGCPVPKRVIVASTAADTLAGLDPRRTKRPAPEPRLVAQKVIGAANLWLAFANNAVPTQRRIPRMWALSPEQLALILIVLHRAMAVPMLGSPGKPIKTDLSAGMRASSRILVWDGPAPVAPLLLITPNALDGELPAFGQFREGRHAVSVVAHRYDPGATSTRIGRVMALLRKWAPEANTLRHPAPQHIRPATHPIDLEGGAQ